MIPSNKVPTIVRSQSPSTTWLVDKGRIVRRVDGLQAMMQAVKKLFASERYTQSVYSGNYGVEFEGLIGKSTVYVLAVLEQRISEALMQDDRIHGVKVEHMEVSASGDSIVFVVHIDATVGTFNVQSSLEI